MNGYSASQLVQQLLDVIMDNENIEVENKVKICEKIAVSLIIDAVYL